MCPWVNIQLAKPGPTIGFLNLVMSDGLGGGHVFGTKRLYTRLFPWSHRIFEFFGPLLLGQVLQARVTESVFVCL